MAGSDRRCIDDVGPRRAHDPIEQQIASVRLRGQSQPHAAGTPCVNTIAVARHAICLSSRRPGAEHLFFCLF